MLLMNCNFGAVWLLFLCGLSLPTGVNVKEVNKENKGTIFGEIYTSIDTLAFTFGNV